MPTGHQSGALTVMRIPRVRRWTALFFLLLVIAIGGQRRLAETDLDWEPQTRVENNEAAEGDVVLGRLTILDDVARPTIPAGSLNLVDAVPLPLTVAPPVVVPARADCRAPPALAA